jgi:hypothetical protein
MQRGQLPVPLSAVEIRRRQLSARAYRDKLELSRWLRTRRSLGTVGTAAAATVAVAARIERGARPTGGAARRQPVRFCVHCVCVHIAPCAGMPVRCAFGMCVGRRMIL